MEIKGSVALVAGGASGMGEAVSRYLAEQGAFVVIIDKSIDAAIHIAKEIKGLSVGCDITEAKALEEVYLQLEKKLPHPISIAVNCAGIAPAKRMVGKTGPVELSWFENVIKINLIGTFNVMRLSASQMMKNTPNENGERGVIINTASIAATDGQVGQTAYSASKGAIAAMTLPAARELASMGIRVMTISPGLIETPMLQGFPNEVRDSLKAQTLFPKRFGSAKEYASLVTHIIQNPMLNGEIIRLDGGMRMQAK